MSKKILHKNMQKKKPAPVSVTVPGLVNPQGNTIQFVLNDKTRLFVYRDPNGQWLATLEGVML